MIAKSGDISCPQIKWNDVYPRKPDYVSDFMLCNSLIQCNGVPSNVCGNILDLLFVNDESKVDQVAAMVVDFTTDHIIRNLLLCCLKNLMSAGKFKKKQMLQSCCTHS